MTISDEYKQLRSQGKTDKESIKLLSKKHKMKKSEIEFILNV